MTDSAKEFKGHAFQRRCDDYGIRIRDRNRGRVHQGGVDERLLGKLNAVLVEPMRQRHRTKGPEMGMRVGNENPVTFAAGLGRETPRAPVAFAVWKDSRSESLGMEGSNPPGYG